MKGKVMAWTAFGMGPVSIVYLPGFWWAAVWLSNGLNR